MNKHDVLCIMAAILYATDIRNDNPIYLTYKDAVNDAAMLMDAVETVNTNCAG